MSTTSKWRSQASQTALTATSPIRELRLQRGLSSQPSQRALLTFKVVEDFFFKQKPFSLVRHVAVTVAIVFSAMASE